MRKKQLLSPKTSLSQFFEENKFSKKKKKASGTQKLISKRDFRVGYSKE